MTEQEMIAVIKTLGIAYHWKIKNKPWYPEPQYSQEDLIHSTLTALRALHDSNHLNAKDVCEYLIVPCYETATEQQKKLCEDAVQAMREILEAETAE